MDQTLFKMYVTYIPPDHIVKSYGTYGSSMGMEALTLHPKERGKTITDVFFKHNRPFSYHCGREEFTISPTLVDCSLLEFLNFGTNADDGMSNERKISQYQFLREFIAGYKELESGKEVSVGDPHPGTTRLECFDKSVFCLSIL